MSEFLSAATSVFSFIEFTAERTRTGYRWRTLNYEDRPHYHYNIFHGVGGIPIFLGAYYQATKSEAALQYAHGAIRWCVEAKPDSMCFQRGLQFGRLGVAYAAVRLSEITGKDPVTAYYHGDRRSNPTLCTGLAGGGELFVELFRNSADPLWLARAQEFARLASAYKARVGGQDYWPTDTPNCYSADFTYGGSGTGYFFLRTHSPSDYDAPLM